MTACAKLCVSRQCCLNDLSADIDMEAAAPLLLPRLNPITYCPPHPGVRSLAAWTAAAMCALLCLQARVSRAAELQHGPAATAA
jgi:hypothetical protein